MAVSVGAPPLPPRMRVRSTPSPYQVLHITSKKLDREAGSGTPNLRRLVLCANTYDTALSLQARFEKTRTEALDLAAAARAQLSTTPQTQSLDESAACLESTVDRADARLSPESAGICTSVVEVIDDDDFNTSSIPQSKVGKVEYISHGVTEDLFEDWDLDRRSDCSVTDSSESDTESDGDDAQSDDES